MEFFAEVVSISKIKQNCYLNVRFAKLEQLVPGRVQAIGIDSCRSAISLKHSFRLETTRTQNQRLFQTEKRRSGSGAIWQVGAQRSHCQEIEAAVRRLVTEGEAAIPVPKSRFSRVRRLSGLVRPLAALTCTSATGQKATVGVAIRFQ